MLWDIAATFLAYFIAAFLTGLLQEILEESFQPHEIYFMIGVAAVVYLVFFVIFRLYNSLWEYTSLDDAFRIIMAVGLGTLVTAVVLWMLEHWIPIRIYFVQMCLMVFFTGGSRILFRVVRSHKRDRTARISVNKPRTLIVGAGETGSLAIARMASNDPNMPGVPVVAVDDNPAKQGKRIHGVRVMGSSEDIIDLVDLFDV